MTSDRGRLAAALRRRGLTAVVAEDTLGYRVVVRVDWPFDLHGKGSPGTTYTINLPVSGVEVARNVEALADHLADEAERHLTVALLSALRERATEIGVHRRALAPYAREVIDGALGGAAYGMLGSDDVRHWARPWTDADARA